MEFVELLFAASVRDLASRLHRSRRMAVFAAWPDDVSNTAAVVKWDAENPVLGFVPEAIAQIKEVADMIRVSK